MNIKRGVELEFRILPVFLFQLARFIITDTVRGRGNIKYKKGVRCGTRSRGLVRPILEETDASHTLGVKLVEGGKATPKEREVNICELKRD